MEDNTTIVLLCAAFLLVGIFSGATMFASESIKEIPVISEKLVYVNVTSPTEFILTQSDFELQEEENQAVKLALESIDSRDFKKAVFDALVSFNESIESYKDIDDIFYEYDVEGNEVDFDKIKVYYFIDGDKDETEKARFNDFTIEILDLDFDDLSDAEVNSTYMDSLLVNKVY